MWQGALSRPQHVFSLYETRIYSARQQNLPQTDRSDIRPSAASSAARTPRPDQPSLLWCALGLGRFLATLARRRRSTR